MKDCCSNCNLKGGLKQIRGSVKVLCLYTDNWYKENYSCGYWKAYDRTSSEYDKLKSIEYAKNKNKEYSRHLKCVTTAGLVSIFGSIAIVVFMLVVMIAAYGFSEILR
ncbi:MAG: hypothetical protein Q7O04_00940 [Candidatus Omnitrophota bacterium]|nr:hypothetical protein [Candidatus Omnitrophota bacterium]